MTTRARRVYCAGPLFNEKEKEEMAEISCALEQAGFDTFLPQRDGLELTVCLERLKDRGVTPDLASEALSRAIFALDVYQVIDDCDAIVVNLNGRVPDEGAVSEAAMAWCHGKVMAGYKADGRSVFEGQDNPLVAGLFEFRLFQSVADVVEAVGKALAEQPSREERFSARKRELRESLDLGERIWLAMQQGDRIERVTALLAEEELIVRGEEPVST